MDRRGRLSYGRSLRKSADGAEFTNPRIAESSAAEGVCPTAGECRDPHSPGAYSMAWSVTATVRRLSARVWVTWTTSPGWCWSMTV